MNDYFAVDKAWARGDAEKFLKIRNGCRNHGRQHWPAKTPKQRSAAKKAAVESGQTPSEYDGDDWEFVRTVSVLSIGS